MTTLQPATLLSGDLLAAIRAENLAVYRASAQRLREDVGQEAQIAQDYRGRLVFEMLQNADDAMADEPEGTGCIRFELTDRELWVGNSGRPLDEADIRGLCGISASSKATRQMGKRRASIGHKGMGFKSVLEITEGPEVYSTSLCFRFGPQQAREEIATLGLDDGRRAPITRFPKEIPSSAAWEQLQRRGMRTAFRFPFRERMSQEQQQRLAAALRELPITALVFLKHLGRVEIGINRGDGRMSAGWSVVRQKRIGDAWATVGGFSTTGLYRVLLTPDSAAPIEFMVAHDGNVEIGPHRGGLDDFTWEGIEFSEVTVATKLEQGLPAALPPAWRKLHVFLPTQETCPYHLLVSGAFHSNLSRQEMRVEADPLNYNSFLLRRASETLRDILIPGLLRAGIDAAAIVRMLDRHSAGAPTSAGAAAVLHGHVRATLSTLSFLDVPSGAAASLAECVVPPIIPDAEFGREFRRILREDAGVGGRTLPEERLCGSDVARALVDLGAASLTVAEVAGLLATVDPDRACLEEHPSGGLMVDPVLRILQRLWAGLPQADRDSLSDEVCERPVFPVAVADGRVLRESVGDRACFYPPRSLGGLVPLDHICFMLQDVCWGALTPRERNQDLQTELPIWQALFGLQEFKFTEVMRASVLPALDLDADRTREDRVQLRTLERLAAICQLAGRTPKRTAPLPYERLGTNRALFNLSRLELPCRGPGSEIIWVPAYRAYLGEDWVGSASLEHVIRALRAVGADAPAVDFVVGPARLAGLLEQYQHLKGSTEDEPDQSSDDDEVGLDEDDEAALDADDHSRWLEFFLWLGANQSLRPVHFHDVEDRGGGWLRTADLKRPEGWAFRDLPTELWRRYIEHVRSVLDRTPSEQVCTPYFYELHDLEHLVLLLRGAAADPTATVARALYEHLARNWPILEPFSRCQIARVPAGQVPSMRTKPPRARREELVEVEQDLWLFRLRAAAFCPTPHGPRPPEEVWMPGPEVSRRFGRRNTDKVLLPVLDFDPALPRGRARPFAQALGIRDELTSWTFNLRDAAQLLALLRSMYEAQCGDSRTFRLELREQIRPAYRHLLELLTGSTQAEPGCLAGAPLLASDGKGGYKFASAAEMYFVERGDTRARLPDGTELWTFILDAHPAARQPLTTLFGMRVLEEEISWAPVPGETALAGADLARFRAELADLAPYALARVAVDRADPATARQDARRIRSLIDVLEPVSSLALGCTVDGALQAAGETDRDAFVLLHEGEAVRGYVVWGDHPWPPDEREAEALAAALAETLGATYFESFLALAMAPSAPARLRLLKRAGAPLDIDEKRALLFDEIEVAEVGAAPPEITPTAAAPVTETAAHPGEARGGVGRDVSTRVRLHPHDHVLVDGEPIRIQGTSRNDLGQAGADRGPGGRHGGSHDGYGGNTDLVELNQLGMRIALVYEQRRLHRSGLTTASIFDSNSDQAQPDALVFDVSTPEQVRRAREGSERFARVLDQLRTLGVSADWPGFDILTLRSTAEGELDRLIELKSSGVSARTQDMSWNEWKTASTSALRSRFFLYLVGNLRADIGSPPFIRTIRDPFEQLTAEVQTTQHKRLQLAVHLFREAEHLELTVQPPRAS